MKRQPNIVFCTHTSPSYMPAAELSTRQIVVGPNMPDKKSGMGRIMSIKTPREFDLAALIEQLPSDQKPELVVVLVDSFLSCVPRNLQNVTCRKMLYVADTHHGVAPLCKAFNYIAQEKFDRYAVAHDPHHLHWFAENGVAPVSVQLNVSARDFIKPSLSSNRKPGIFFVGQAAKVHAWRGKLLARLEGVHIPMQWSRIPASEAAKQYDMHQLCLNTSNGDWTMRFFEVLASGGCLLTDRISEASGYGEYFREGEDFIFYDDEDDLVAKAQYYLERPELCLQIARSGHAKYKQHFSEEKRKQRFLEFAFASDSEAAETALKHQAVDPRCAPQAAEAALFQSRILAYEQVQELQRADLAQFVQLSAGTPEILASDLADLMRMKVSRDNADPDSTCLILDEAEVEQMLQAAESNLPRFVFVMPGQQPPAETLRRFADKGYATTNSLLMSHPGFFERATNALSSSGNVSG